MATTKLTLSADSELIERAKQLAEENGTSLSSMFARMLRAALRAREERPAVGPLTQAATGLVRLPTGMTDDELLEASLASRDDL